jgi:hypothetical protein
MGGNDPAPHAYSTHLGGDYQSGYTADGYNIVIDPDQLRSSIDTYKRGLAGMGPQDLITTVTNALIDSGAFGTLPNAATAFNEVQTFVKTHTSAMAQMGVSIEDFVARVQAAAELGYEADPETKRQAAMRGHGRMLAE